MAACLEMKKQDLIKSELCVSTDIRPSFDQLLMRGMIIKVENSGLVGLESDIFFSHFSSFDISENKKWDLYSHCSLVQLYK